mmetsp:Transcript_20950/g.54482  ORF Transcript_20950/g.54482 Transcript_20950/m.54482 type:complete len:272 (+) Transcript_20950:105-920(+)
MAYHEKQEGSLCAQHALNNLLQGRYFTAVDLADIARQLDEEERLRMAEGGLESASYLAFMAAESSNYDDSGFFSSQVIAQALKSFEVDIVNIKSPDVVAERAKPESQAAFIFWLREHWYTVRKIGDTWWNLDSMLDEPRLVSEMYLGMLLLQMEAEGYTVFLIKGTLPQNTGLFSPAAGGVGHRLGSGGFDDALQQAIAASMHEGGPPAGPSEDDELQAAIAMSLEQPPQVGGGVPSEPMPGAAAAPTESEAPPRKLSPEELRAKRLARFG